MNHGMDSMNDMDAYLDGVMDEAECRTFERRLDQDAELRAAVALQHDIDDVLRRRFAAPGSYGWCSIARSVST